jgi:predicted SnoaL-like aldol condensation-catalyzing enzyme
METLIKKVSENFSTGSFELAYPHLAEDILWNIPGATTLKGKQAVVSWCENLMVENPDTNYQLTNLIVDGDSIAVQGFCSYTDEDGKTGKVEFCDVYYFKAEKLQEITSYAVEGKIADK